MLFAAIRKPSAGKAGLMGGGVVATSSATSRSIQKRLPKYHEKELRHSLITFVDKLGISIPLEASQMFSDVSYVPFV